MAMQLPELLFEKHPHPIIAYDVDTLDILKVNQCACIHYGYTKEEFLEGTVQLIRAEENEETLRENLDLEAENQIMYRGTVEHRTCSDDRMKVNITTQSFEITCDENIEMNVNQAMPTALIINELVTNALEHAFLDSEEPKLWVSLLEEGDELTLEITDNGRGLPEDYRKHLSDSLGMTIVNKLVKQLDADFEVRQNGGTSYNLRFKKGDVSGSSSNYFV